MLEDKVLYSQRVCGGSSSKKTVHKLAGQQKLCRVSDVGDELMMSPK